MEDDAKDGCVIGAKGGDCRYDGDEEDFLCRDLMAWVLVDAEEDNSFVELLRLMYFSRSKLSMDNRLLTLLAVVEWSGKELFLWLKLRGTTKGEEGEVVILLV